MAVTRPAKSIDLSDALSRLEPLGTDQYFIAFGPAGRQFCGTPNGYSATFLPAKVCDDITSGNIKKVIWASFGSDPDSYFFFYEMQDGAPKHRIGKGTPSSLQLFVRWASSSDASFERASSLRVQLGDGRSWFAWSGGVWACRLVPHSLLKSIRALSHDAKQDTKLGWRGALSTGSLKNVTWHKSGTYHVMAEEHWWCFKSETVEEAWAELWKDEEELSTLAHVSFDPYSATGNTFAFIKAQRPGKEADFVLRFESEGMISRVQGAEEAEDDEGRLDELDELEATTEATDAGFTESTGRAGAEALASEATEMKNNSPEPEYHQTVHMPKRPEPKYYQWAFAKHNGRPHWNDSWELDVKKGEKLKVLQDAGKDWYIVQNVRNIQGWVHGSALDFKEMHRHADPCEAYARWAEDIEKLLKPGVVCSFPDLSSYMNACGRFVCQQVKKESIGICAHDLSILLSGSGRYSLDFLKAQRNNWHPDMFGRFCHPDHRDRLKPQAESLFVLFGVLMDWEDNPPVDD